MADTNERIEQALAAHLEHLEMGGPEPDTSHLTDSEREELTQLIAALELTQGVAFGLGRREGIDEPVPSRSTGALTKGRPEQSDALVAELHAALPPEARLVSDAPLSVSHVGGIEVLDAWIVGTFGGRIRIWLLAAEHAHEVEENSDCLDDLNRVFRMSADTAAIALVGTDLSCLVVRPEDTGPQIHVPSGSLIGRGYTQSIQPVGEAVSAFLHELIPYWDPVPALDHSAGLSIDLSVVGEDAVTAAVEEQRRIGERARKGNPKKDALLELGSREVNALTKLAKGLFDGTVDPNDVAERIEKLAKNR